MRPPGAVWSRALLGGDGGEGGPALLHFLATAVRAQNLTLFVVDEREDLGEQFFAIVAEEFVVGHTHLPQFLKGSGRILDPGDGGINTGQVSDLVRLGSLILRGQVTNFS